MRYKTKQEIETVIGRIKERSLSDTAYLESLRMNPAQMFEKEGLLIGRENYAEFNRTLQQVAPHVMDGNPFEAEVDCATCKAAATGVAVLIAGLGAAGLAALTPESAVAIAVAEFLGVSVTEAIIYLKTLTAVVSSGTTAIVNQLCSYLGCC